ncbi:MAG: aminoacyl-tRNA hydrolase [Bacilli bacterium]|nr:aminoacyl-tRNA hydrolase [Bacilli bacterium]
MKLIVGLGNPDKEYENTRHNIGFMIVDNFVDNLNWTKKHNSLIYSTNISGQKVLFVKPLTYMNNSGLAVREIANYYDVDINDILIIHDDLDLAFGTYKLKKNSSSGGHNGIKSIISNLHSEAFARLKVGISKANGDVKDYVLGKFSKAEIEKINDLYPIFNKIIETFISDGIEKAMMNYNKKGE